MSADTRTSNDQPELQQPTEKAPGKQVLLRLLNATNLENYSFTDRDKEAIRELATTDSEFEHICEYLYSCDRRLYGKELARFLGSIRRIPLSMQQKLKLGIVGFGNGKVVSRDPATKCVRHLVSPEELFRNFGQISQKELLNGLERQLELTIWGRWIDESTFDLERKQTAHLLLRKVSADFLWKEKDKLDPETDISKTAVVNLLDSFKESLTIISDSYQTELAKIVSYLQKYLPDFDEEDVRFGDTFDLMDPLKTEAFNFHYAIALVIKLLPCSSEDTTFPYFLQAVQRLEASAATSLVKANSDIDFAKFSLKWSENYCGFSVETKVLKKYLFDHELEGSAFVKSLVKQIWSNICAFSADSKKYHAPYSAVCQSSGSGKTKAMIGMGEFSILFYICCREAKSNGYPPRSKIMDLIEKFKCGADFLALFFAILEVFLALIQDSNRTDEISQQHLGESGSKNFFKSFSLLLADPSSNLHLKFWNDVTERVLTFQTAKPSESSTHPSSPKGSPAAEPSNPPVSKSSAEDGHSPAQALGKKPATPVAGYEYFYSKAAKQEIIFEESVNRLDGTVLNEVEMFPGWIRTALTSLMKMVVDAASLLPGAPESSEIPIIMVFDEARNLLRDTQHYDGSLFRRLRHACVMLKENGYILLADTTSKTSNFAFAMENDPSSRRMQEGGDLFPPFLYLPLMNVISVTWPDGVVQFESAPACSSGWAPLQYDPLDCVSLSRPAFVVAADNDTSLPAVERFESAVEYTLSKLDIATLSSTTSTAKRQMKHLSRAISAGLLDLSFSDFKINDDLVASYLAVGVSLTEDRSFLRARYLPEAVLAEAFAEMYRKYRDDVLKQLAADVEHCLPLESDQGLKGEMLAGFLLLHTKFGCDIPNRTRNPHCIPITVHNFFKHLFNDDARVMSHLDDETANSFIAFNSIKKSEVPITAEVLFDAWRRRVVLVSPPNTPAIDLVIPIVKGRNGSSVVVPDVKNMSAIAIQVKNWSQPLTYGKPTPTDSKKPAQDTPASATTNTAMAQDGSPSATTNNQMPQDAAVSATSNKKPVPDGSKNKTAWSIANTMVHSVIEPNGWAPIGIIMAVGRGGMGFYCPRVIELEDSSCKIFTVDTVRNFQSLSSTERQHFARIRDPTPPIPAGFRRQFQSLKESERKERISDLQSRWAFCDISGDDSSAKPSSKSTAASTSRPNPNPDSSEGRSKKSKNK